MPRPLSPLLLALVGAVASTFACVIPEVPLSNNITEGFSIFVQNPSLPIIHNRVMRFRPNGLDKHLVLSPAGDPTYDLMYLENGLLTYEGRHAVIDLEYNPADDTTKIFMTDRTYHPTAIFQPVYGCNPDTDDLQIGLQLVSRLTDPPVDGGQIGIQLAGDTYEFRYSPPGNTLLDARWLSVTMVIFRDGISPPPPSSTTSSSSPAATPSSIGDYDFVSCWAEPDGGRTLETVYSTDDMTNEKCAALCGGSEYIGTQWSRECWCGSSLGAGSSPAPSTDCSYVCIGDPTEICGGSRRLSLYRLKSTSSSSLIITTTSSESSTTSSFSTTSLSSSTTSSQSSTTSSQSSTSTSILSTTSTTASTTPSNPASLPSVGKYNFVSCWAEPPDGRALTAALTSADDMTLEKCAQLCSRNPYFGTEWSRECWCGVELTSGSAPAPLSECNYPCTGDATEMCGGSRRLSLYHNDAWTAPQLPNSIGNYALYGCVTDSPSHRTLTGASLSNSDMTLEMCATFCSAYKYFGTEWSVECWCGNVFTAGAAQVDNGQCSMTCGGNSDQLCGNGDRLSVYQLAVV
ncbi:WSC-domain-containing protein [Lepidopterella palustris CBS 459.81]|uniref:WSC-domain-containing protein n=1 Tax=Lepidopterella palustris CBS 459.81 TaxID=1314670 RepID=A0A8E2J8J2_9PEZI|nr:WSC-domain-containing protein [Lepidopterella palustris CBS 459.81]